MKIYRNIIGLLFIATVSVNCNKGSLSVGSNENSVDLDARYILFDSGISTRGELITRDYLDAHFSVLGYEYPGSWDIAWEHTKPLVFDAVPQKVKFDQTTSTYSYDNPKIWSGNAYSFFAYYPDTHDNIALFDGGEIEFGIPYITYSLPIDISESTTSTILDPRDLVDVMTGSYIDTRISYGAEVTMLMHHRLSAIDVAVRNYYMYETDADPEPAKIEITKLQFNPIVSNTQAAIYLDGSKTEGNGRNIELQIPLIGNDSDLEWVLDSKEFEPNNSTKPLSLVTSDKTTTILLIPQTEKMQFSLEMEYKVKTGDGYIENPEPKVGQTDPYLFSHSESRSFDKSLVEGNRYNVEITFTQNAVTINITTADEWDYNEDVKHEFE